MTNQTPLPLRHDTILGVCEAIGRDFGFNPLWLRLAFIAPMFFAPVAGLAAYLGLGLIVAGTRLLVRDKPTSRSEVGTPTVSQSAVVEAGEALPIAA